MGGTRAMTPATAAGRQVLIVAMAALLVLSSCSLPRGAAIQGEVLRGSTSETRDFAVEPVTRDRLALLQSWPVPAADEGWLARNPGPMTLVIRPGDRVAMTIWDNSENSLLTSDEARVVRIENVQVGAAGTLFVPYVGEVVINGMTPDQARREIQAQLDAILPAAQVLLTVEPGRASSVSVVGGVARPGPVQLPDRNFSILDLIAQAGGVQPSLTNPRVRLVRGHRTYGISLSRLLENPGTLDVTMHGGDQVIVQPDGRTFIALGASGRQDIIEFPQDRLTALEAVALIGGLASNRADLKGVLILRQYPASAVRDPLDPESAGPDRAQVVFTLDLTSTDGLFSARQFEIAEGDTVLVTESPVNALRTVMGLIGQGFGLARQID